ncbi:MAG: hypothetical protein RLZZ301_1291 [Bacteroidota bacterium]|jgi:hypothetical protein
MRSTIYRYGANAQLFGFEDPILEVPILNQTLDQYQKAVCAQCGFQIVDLNNIDELPEQAETLWYFDAKLVFTAAFFRAAQEAVQIEKGSHFQFGLDVLPSVRQHSLPTEPDLEVRTFPFFFRRKDAVSKLERIDLSGKEFEWEIDMPTQIIPSGRYSLNQNAVFASLLLSPFHLLGANMALNLNRSLPFQEKLPEWLRTRITKPFTRLTSFGLRRMNQKGRNCRIHPSAVVEGCVLGDNVTIGANAVVRMSVIGAGTFIADTAVVSFSVLGEKNFVSTGNHLVNSMTYESVFTIHGPYQYSIFGKNSAVFATINSDIRLDLKTIKIPTEQGVHDSGQLLLGVAYGHACKIGGSNIIAAGRLVPNGYVLNPPDFITLKFE